ncbi:hypothetical protein [Lysinibacillus xylanilyticus]|uniref:hypothetical protein n=1 Tax=Lysinibacillus xylanilyticus TaxID=582475 RepID=UPI0036DBF8D2
MLLSVIAEYRNSPMLRVLQVDEETGDLDIVYIDSSNDDVLKELEAKLQDGVSYADFQIIKTQTEEGLDAYELRHFCTNVAPGEPDLDNQGPLPRDNPSFLGFLRKLIHEGGNIILPLKNVPQDDIPEWMISSAGSVQFTEDMGIKVSHLIPDSEPDTWRWASSVIVQADNRDQFGDVTGHMFLCPTEFEVDEYTDYLVEHPERSVMYDSGDIINYRVFSVTSDLPIYPRKSNVLVTPPNVSKFKFVADSYKLALYCLTEGLFEPKTIVSSYGDRNPAMATGRTLKLKNSTPISKKTAGAMQDHMLGSLKNKDDRASQIEFLKQYPHYEVFTSIIKNQISIFFGPSPISKQQKMRAYRALKNTETYFYLLLQECRYHIMFDNDAYLFNLWTNNASFNSDIPNYKVTISGGGGTWHPNASYFL